MDIWKQNIGGPSAYDNYFGLLMTVWIYLLSANPGGVNTIIPNQSPIFALRRHGWEMQDYDRGNQIEHIKRLASTGNDDVDLYITYDGGWKKATNTDIEQLLQQIHELFKTFILQTWYSKLSKNEPLLCEIIDKAWVLFQNKVFTTIALQKKDIPHARRYLAVTWGIYTQLFLSFD